MVFYLDYVLGLGALSLLVFVQFPQLFRTGDTVATRSISGETPPTKRKLLELTDPWIGSADFYVCFIGRP